MGRHRPCDVRVCAWRRGGAGATLSEPARASLASRASAVVRGAVAVAAAVVVGLAVAARAGVDVAIDEGDRVTGTFDPPSEVESYRVVCPRHAKLTVAVELDVAVRKGAKSPRPVVAVFDPDGAPVAAKRARLRRSGTRLRTSALAASGEYRIDVRGDATADAAIDYELRVSWTSRRTFGSRASVAPATPAEVSFSADPGSTATFVVKPSRGSGAVPRLGQVRDADGVVVHEFAAADASGPAKQVVRDVVLAAGGDLTLTVLDAGRGGGFSAAIAVRQPPGADRDLDVSYGALPPLEGRELVCLVIGPEGGLLDGSFLTGLEGATLSVPSGAVPYPTVFLLGTDVPIATGDARLVGAGPPVFFGPGNRTFDPGARPNLTIPFDPTLVPPDGAGVRLFVRRNGVVEEVADFTLDVATGTVSFPADHFSTYQIEAEAVLAGENPYDPEGGSFGGSDLFGGAVAIEGDIAVVGAPAERDPVAGVPGAGAAYVFRREPRDGRWYQAARLSAEAEDYAAYGGHGISFGGSVAVSGNLVLVGSQQGAFAFAPQGSTWYLHSRVRSALPFGGSGFCRVALDGDTAVVAGSWRSDWGDLGQAVVFVRSGAVWTEQALLRGAELPAPPPGPPVTFGNSVACRGDVVAIGCVDRLPEGTWNPGDHEGGVFVFTRVDGVWSQSVPRLRPAEVTTWTRTPGDDGFVTDPGSRFGASVALDDGRLAVGAPSHGGLAGAVWVYHLAGPSPVETRLDGSDPDPHRVPGQFGTSVGLSGDRLVVGAPSVSTEFNGPVAGPAMAVVFSYSGNAWVESARIPGPVVDMLFPDDLVRPTQARMFGCAVALSGSTACIGAVTELDPSPGGRAFIYYVP